MQRHSGALSLALLCALSAVAPAACGRGQLRDAEAMASASPPLLSPQAPAPPADARPTSRLEPCDPSARLRESAGIVVAAVEGHVLAFVADGDEHAVAAVDAATLAPLAKTELPGRPHGMLLGPGGELFVTLPDEGLLLALAPVGDHGELRVLRTTKTPAEPLAIALTPDDATLLVTTGASHTLSAFDAKTLASRWSRSVAAEPRALAVGRDGKRAFFTHATSSGLSMVRLDESARVPETAVLELGVGGGSPSCSYKFDPPRAARHVNSLVRKTSKKGLDVLYLPVVQNAPKGSSVSGYGADGSVGRMTTPGPFRTSNVLELDFGMSVLDLRTVPTEKPELASRDELGQHWFVQDCLLPGESVATERGVLVTCTGESRVLEITGIGNGYATTRSARDVPRGPSAIATIPGKNRAIVWSQLARAVSLVELSVGKAKDKPEPALATHALARTTARDERALRGEEIFQRTNDRALSSDGVACASCHPGGRDDGLVWSSAAGGLHTLSLAGNLDKPLFGWSGDTTTLESRIGKTIARLRGRGLDAGGIGDLAAYLRSLRPAPQLEPSAAEADGVTHGAALFRSSRAGCATCHVENKGFADGQLHDVGSGGMFLTPSLRGAGARRALFHDGRYHELDKLLTSARSMGGGAELDANERADLTLFLGTL